MTIDSTSIDSTRLGIMHAVAVSVAHLIFPRQIRHSIIKTPVRWQDVVTLELENESQADTVASAEPREQGTGSTASR